MNNISNDSDKFCEHIIETGLHADILSNLNWKSLTATTLNEPWADAKRKFVLFQQGILHNVARITGTKAREAFRECHAVNIVQKFRDVTADPVIFLFSFLRRRCIKPNTHRRRRRDATVELSCVGGVYAPVGRGVQRHTRRRKLRH